MRVVTDVTQQIKTVRGSIGTGNVVLTPSGTGGTAGSWVEVDSALAKALVRARIGMLPPSSTVGLGYEVEVGIGAGGSEVSKLSFFVNTGSWGGSSSVRAAQHAEPPLDPSVFAAGVRVAARVTNHDSNGTSTLLLAFTGYGDS